MVSGYALTFGGFLLLGGRAGLVVGRTRRFAAERQAPLFA